MRTTLKTAAAITVAALTLGGYNVVGATNDDPPGPDANDPLLLEPDEIARNGPITLLYPALGTLPDGRTDRCLMRLVALNHSNQPVDIALVGVDNQTVDDRAIPAGGQVTLVATDWAYLDHVTDANTVPLRVVWADGEQAVASLLDPGLDRPDGCWTPTLPSPWTNPDRAPDVLPSNPRVECINDDAGRPVCRLRPVE